MLHHRDSRYRGEGKLSEPDLFLKLPFSSVPSFKAIVKSNSKSGEGMSLEK